MTKCPECGKNMKKEKREISPGIYAQVEVCSKCNDEWLDEDEYEKLRALCQKACPHHRSIDRWLARGCK